MNEVVTDTYDSNGDVIRRDTATFEYDDQGIRVEATNKVEIDHDSNPATALQVDSEETTTYLNDPMNHTGYSQVIEEVTYDELAEAEVDRSIYTLGVDILSQFRINSVNTSGANYYFQYDGHGSTRMLTDLLGAIATYNSVTQIFAYDAYGKALGFNAEDAATNFLYSGEQFDPRLQLQYLRARYYDVSTGSFNRLDPFFGVLHDPQSLHKYLYASGDPVNGIDPTGLFTVMEVNVSMNIATVTEFMHLTAVMGARAAAGSLLGYNVGRHLGAYIGFLDAWMEDPMDIDNAFERMEKTQFYGGYFGALEGLLDSFLPCSYQAVSAVWNATVLGVETTKQVKAALEDNDPMLAMWKAGLGLTSMFVALVMARGGCFEAGTLVVVPVLQPKYAEHTSFPYSPNNNQDSPGDISVILCIMATAGGFWFLRRKAKHIQLRDIHEKQIKRKVLWFPHQ
ncbi:MAG: RHS repeat-associated core domain-containing protein [Planctomycetaceae bacterium]|nr:RHS repeat-associated core domain-containing protein [Planctomycetaceae bacterium]